MAPTFIFQIFSCRYYYAVRSFPTIEGTGGGGWGRVLGTCKVGKVAPNDTAIA